MKGSRRRELPWRGDAVPDCLSPKVQCKVLVEVRVRNIVVVVMNDDDQSIDSLDSEEVIQIDP